MASPTLLAVSHGTDNAAGARAIADLVNHVAEDLADVEVRSAFVDVQQPDAVDARAAIDGPVVIVPLLLSSGFHVHHDLHGIAREQAETVVADPLGPDARLAEVLAERLAQVADATQDDSPVILAVAGSRDPRSLTDVEAMADLLRARLGRPVELAFLAARKPDLPEVLARHPHAAVSTYLLAEGYFFDLARKLSGSRVISAPLLDGGAVPAPLVDLVRARYLDAVRDPAQ